MNEETTQNETERKLTIKSRRFMVMLYMLLIIISLFIIFVGGIVAIRDMVGDEGDKSFGKLTLASQIMIVAVSIIILIFILLFLAVLYKKGFNAITNRLYPDLEVELERKKIEEYGKAKYFVGLVLISMFMIAMGLLISLFEHLFKKGNYEEGFWSTLGELRGGALAVVIGIVIFLLSLFIYLFHYLLQNGFNYLIGKIYDFNQRFKENIEIPYKRKVFTQLIYVIFVINVVLIGISVLWAILDAIALDWNEEFANLTIGTKISIIGVLLTFLFLILVGALMLHRWGLGVIYNSLFKRIENKEEVQKDHFIANFLSYFLLLAIFLLILSFIIWLVSKITGAISDQEYTSFFDVIDGLKPEFKLLSYSLFIFTVNLLTCSFVYMLKNGYVVVYKFLEKTEQKLDDNIA